MDIEQFVGALADRGASPTEQTLRWNCGCTATLMQRPPKGVPGYEDMQTGWIVEWCSEHREIPTAAAREWEKSVEVIRQAIKHLARRNVSDEAFNRRMRELESALISVGVFAPRNVQALSFDEAVEVRKAAMR